MGFLELVVIAIIGLLVIGPEQLPDAIKSGIKSFARIKQALSNAKSELEHQIGADEIKRELHNEQVMRSLETLKSVHKELQQQIHTNDGSNTPSSAKNVSNDDDHDDHPDSTHPNNEPVNDAPAMPAKNTQDT